MFRDAIRAYRVTPTRYQPLIGGLITALVVLSVNSFFINGWTLPPFACIGWLLFGAITSRALLASREPDTLPTSDTANMSNTSNTANTSGAVGAGGRATIAAPHHTGRRRPVAAKGSGGSAVSGAPSALVNAPAGALADAERPPTRRAGRRWQSEG
jgi:hypothetical protein